MLLLCSFVSKQHKNNAYRRIFKSISRTFSRTMPPPLVAFCRRMRLCVTSRKRTHGTLSLLYTTKRGRLLQCTYTRICDVFYMWNMRIRSLYCAALARPRLLLSQAATTTTTRALAAIWLRFALFPKKKKPPPPPSPLPPQRIARTSSSSVTSRVSLVLRATWIKLENPFSCIPFFFCDSCVWVIYWPFSSYTKHVSVLKSNAQSFVNHLTFGRYC